MKANGAPIDVIRNWLLGDAITGELSTIVEGLGYRLLKYGVPVHRLTVNFGLINPSLLAAGLIWRPGRPIDFVRYDYANRDSGMYERSPFKLAEKEGRRISIDVAATPDDAFGVIPELKAEGLCHYAVFPLRNSVGTNMYLTIATRDAADFTPAQYDLLDALSPAIVAMLEIKTLRFTLRDVLGAYVGRAAAREIVQGTVHRGQVTAMRAAILVADLRRFTQLSTELPPEATADLINRYYDMVVPAIEAGGGEVLKFIGDAVLAVFPVNGNNDATATLAALDAARAALAANDGPFEVNGRELAITFGIALHIGEAVYGNVGSGNRLDFTVIGRDVNIAARIGTLCSRLGRNFLVSAAVADIARAHGQPMTDAGAHAVRGLDRPLTVFVPGDGPLDPETDDGVSQGLVFVAPE
ncbi:adenylate/guanylate cyclase domain-containing protein [Acuticoccus mangrovi]|uniref:Adenylate/guanylate cyclase domain-containing protein n=1 Tax=Acuticoccus mangrovi TaxID=2796142 RepID=A0A934IMK7_9HYPH|nr:adenylate/guanylate cyclase domain-containing protein [Acuticoccus mangrovi]MBJ3774997.1 adenylate/guanylate cyclase domain-containing protein [Acuticoccus mangrovi]